MLADCLARADERRARPNVREAISVKDLKVVPEGVKVTKLCDSKSSTFRIFHFNPD